MHLKVILFTLSFLATSAYPLHRNTREITWINSKANQVHDKINFTKDVDGIYKSHIDSNNLYSQEERDNNNPVAQEMQHKINMESERLRIRVRQELAELQERLAPSPTHLYSTLASMRERLAPLTQQLQSSLSSSTQDLCGQLSLYFKSLESAEAQSEASPALYQEAFHWMTQTLEHGSFKMADIISDFQTKSVEVIEHLREISTSEEEVDKSDIWKITSSRLGEEVNSLRVETQDRIEALRADLALLLEAPQRLKAEVAASIKQFCQNAALQTEVSQARMAKFFQELEKELEGHRASSLSPSFLPPSIQPGASLQEDFSVKLSALIQDILHLVQ
ncbi:uncharacterized protein LOC115053575 [Echeneis naucrates]|uniref:Uncharacterized LOC115053575 n=1 Tax=Echeneis naucrates TaxID=173247 RepID=A0A665UN75_ECHNA|nr:uncharacterized protein LOC115053575 [Echeneis naucrates]